jgi:hypothetical protein
MHIETAITVKPSKSRNLDVFVGRIFIVVIGEIFKEVFQVKS